MSPDLIAFLKAWYEWATNGAPDGEPFYRNIGLCISALSYRDAKRELEVLFGGNKFPFGEEDFWRCDRQDTMHECPKRLAWVRERLIEAGELVA